MKIIDTSVVNTTKGYPGLANVNGVSIANGGAPDLMQGLDFLQQANMDNANALALSVASSSTSVTILSGCGLSGTNDIAGGWVYYGGEIFQVEGHNMGSVPFGMPNISATINNSPTDVSIPTTLSDGSTVSMHNQRIITLAWSATAHSTGGSGYLPDYGYWIATQVAQNTANIATNTTDIAAISGAITPVVVGSGGSAPAYSSGYSAQNRLYFYKNFCGEVVVCGDVSYTGSYSEPSYLFTLPLGYRPAATIAIGLAIGDAGSPIAHIQVNSSGNVYLTDSSVSSGSFTTHYTLACTPFLAGI